MANILSCDSDVLSEVPYSDSYPNDMINQDVQEMPYSKQTHIDDFPDNEINTNLDKENQINKMVNESLTVELKRYKERVDDCYGAWFFESKGECSGRGVKEKHSSMAYKEKSSVEEKLTTSGTGLSTKSDDTMNEDTPVVVASSVKEVVTPSVVDMTVETEKQSSLEDTTVLGSFPPLSTQATTTVGNALGKSSYASVTCKPSGKKVNIHTLFTPGGNGIDMVVPMDSIRAISECFANTAYGFFLGKKVAYPICANYVRNSWGKYGLVRSMFSSSTGFFSFQFSSMDGLDAMLENVWVKLHGVPVTAFSEDGLSVIATKLDTPIMLDSYTSDMCMQSWGRSSYTRVMIELRADVKLKDNIVVDQPKITREGHYTCNVRVEWKPPRCSSCKVFGHIHEECPKNTGAGEKKTVKKPSQTSRGILVGLKIGFKPHKEYRPVPKKSNASSSGNKKKGAEPTIEVSNSNPFDVLNLVDNDVEFGTNGRTTNLVNNGATSSGSLFMNVNIVVQVLLLLLRKSGNIKIYLLAGKLFLWIKLANPLKKVEFPGEYDSEDEVASVDNDMARSMAYERVGFGTQSLLEQWRDSYGNGDYDDDPYDDDMYEGQDLYHKLQAICDNIDIRVRGCKKK
ncbi:retrotransposon protein, putative, ty1-copia subclass [Tanacetum coccineum]